MRVGAYSRWAIIRGWALIKFHNLHTYTYIHTYIHTLLHSSPLGALPPYIHELRWLDWIFYGGYLPSLSINYVAMSKDMEKRFPQLYYIKMKNSYDWGFIAIGVAMTT